MTDFFENIERLVRDRIGVTCDPTVPLTSSPACDRFLGKSGVVVKGG